MSGGMGFVVRRTMRHKTEGNKYGRQHKEDVCLNTANEQLEYVKRRQSGDSKILRQESNHNQQNLAREYVTKQT